MPLTKGESPLLGIQFPPSLLAHTVSDLLVHVLGDLDVSDGGGVVAEHVHVRVHDAHVLRAVARFRQRRWKGERRK